MGIMRGCVKDLPAYQWLTALSQLVSRICHQNEEVVRLVKHIVTIVLQTYPQQALWKMAAVSKSTVAARRQAAAEIIQAARRASRQEKSENDLFIQFATLIDHLIRLCFHGGDPKTRTINISSDFSALKRMMPVGVILPVQQALTISLPANGISENYDPFSAGNYATISGIGEDVEILASLQRPKKVCEHSMNDFKS
jgi:serine/threonine-protein kinase ATR